MYMYTVCRKLIFYCMIIVRFWKTARIYVALPRNPTQDYRDAVIFLQCVDIVRQSG